MGPPSVAFGEGRAAVIWVLLLATPALIAPLSFGEETPIFPNSRALAGVGAGAVLDRSMLADLGPSATSVIQVNYQFVFLDRFTYLS
jgi:hypothetical protein